MEEGSVREVPLYRGFGDYAVRREGQEQETLNWKRTVMRVILIRKMKSSRFLMPAVVFRLIA